MNFVRVIELEEMEFDKFLIFIGIKRVDFKVDHFIYLAKIRIERRTLSHTDIINLINM